MYEYRVKRRNKTAAVTVALASAAAAICFASGVLLSQIRSVTEVLGLLFSAFAILVAGRYLLRDHVYAVRESEETGTTLTVFELQGRRSTVVCRIALSDVSALLVETPDNRRALRPRVKETKRYDYCADLCPSRSTYLFFEDGDRTHSVRLEPDERLEGLLLALCSEESGEGKDADKN